MLQAVSRGPGGDGWESGREPDAESLGGLGSPPGAEWGWLWVTRQAGLQAASPQFHPLYPHGVVNRGGSK